MVLPLELQKELLGLPVSVSLSDIPNLLQSMINESLGTSMVNQVVKVSVTGGTSEQPLAVSWRLIQEMT